MYSEFNKKRLFDNISYLLSASGKRIGELEKEVGVSTGYISRAAKDDNNRPGIDFIVNVASALSISLDILINVELSALSPTEQYIMSFMDKLKSDTAMDKLNWNVERSEYLNKMAFDYDFETDNPLFSYVEYEDNGNPEPQMTRRVLFQSKAYGTRTYINGDCFNLKLNNGVRLYLMSIMAHMSHDAYSKELWLCKPDGDKQFLCSSLFSNPFSDSLEHLYTLVEKSTRRPKLSKDFKDAIDAFMDTN